MKNDKKKGDITLFDYSMFQNLSERINIRLQKKDSIVPSSWEIGNIIDNFSNNYYKIELLNAIALALKNRLCEIISVNNFL